ncbi:oxygenase MpaB family protein [Psychrobacter sp. DM8]|uniref:oxygenase MpaB family protein n=1 Tax=Psychrobacter sp. DM8 TaxID=3440636 RepID=UPI003F4F7DB7
MSNLLMAKPQSVKNREKFLELFTEEELQLMLTMAAEGDALADQVVKEQMQADRAKKGGVTKGIKEGLASLTDPLPALKQLLEESETLPEWVDQNSVTKGAENYLLISPLWQSVALGPGALTHTYCSPTIANILMKTGNLANTALRRIAETTIWKQYVLIPGGLKPGNDGYVHTLEVRLLHARVRLGMIKKGWDHDESGAPINQLDMLRTWLDFTYIPFAALQKLGITYNEEEFYDLYHLWQLIAKLLGIPEKYYRLVYDQESAAKMTQMIDLVFGEPNEGSVILTDQMLTAVGHFLTSFLGLPPDTSVDLMHSFLTLIHGEEMAAKLGIKPNPTAALIPVYAAANAYEKQLINSDPAYREKTIQETLAVFTELAKMVEGKTTYQRNVEEIGNVDILITPESLSA